MKTRINTLLTLAVGSWLAFLLGFPASAQDHITNTLPAGAVLARRLDSHAKSGPIRLMRESLNLSDQQIQKLEPVLNEQQVRMTAVRRDTSLSRQERVAKLREIGKTESAKLKTLLTPEQLEKWQRMRTNYQNTVRQQFHTQPHASQ